jgi:activator of HSP90 ATPase
MKSLKQKYVINAPASKVWNALTDSKIIDEWGAGPAKMNSNEGFEFSLWGGDIWGKNIKVANARFLKQEWTSGKWKDPSIVEFTLKEKDGKTTLELNHKNIPDGEYEDIKSGWKDYYLGPLKDLLEK